MESFHTSLWHSAAIQMLGKGARHLAHLKATYYNKWFLRLCSIDCNHRLITLRNLVANQLCFSLSLLGGTRACLHIATLPSHIEPNIVYIIYGYRDTQATDVNISLLNSIELSKLLIFMFCAICFSIVTLYL